MCACTEPVRTGIGAVCVEYGRPKWPVTMLNHSNKQTSLVQKNVLLFYFLHPMLVRPAMKRLFCLKAKNGLGRFAPSALPHYYLLFLLRSICFPPKVIFRSRVIGVCPATTDCIAANNIQYHAIPYSLNPCHTIDGIPYVELPS